jgi:hypothetical protein
MTLKILTDDLWPTLTKLARKSRRAHVAVAYLGKGANKLLPLGKGDNLVVDMSESAVRSSQTNPYEIERYLRKGVDVYTCSNLHAKLYVFDKTLVVGSANVSRRSQQDLVEVGLLCKDKHVLTQARGWVKSLQQGPPVTPGYIRLCKRIYKPPKFPPGPPPAHSRLWVVGVRPVDLPEQEERLFETEEKKVSKKLKDVKKFEVAWIRWIGKSRFVECAREGDQVVQIGEEGKNVKVYPPERIVGIRRYKSFNRWKRPRTFTFLEEPKRPRLLRWTDFKKEVTKAGLSRILPYSTREIRSQEVKNAILGLWSY